MSPDHGAYAVTWGQFQPSSSSMSHVFLEYSTPHPVCQRTWSQSFYSFVLNYCPLRSQRLNFSASSPFEWKGKSRTRSPNTTESPTCDCTSDNPTMTNDPRCFLLQDRKDYIMRTASRVPQPRTAGREARRDLKFARFSALLSEGGSALRGISARPQSHADPARM